MSPTDLHPARTGWRPFAAVLAASLVGAASIAIASGALASTGGQFNDVGPGHPFVDEIDFVSSRGIAQGYPDGTYRPGEPVSRQAMAAFLERSSTYRLVTETVSSVGPSNSFRAAITCERQGDVAVSGGARFDSTVLAYVNESRPTDSGGWLVEMRTLTGEHVQTSVTLFALCAPGRVVAATGGTP